MNRTYDNICTEIEKEESLRMVFKRYSSFKKIHPDMDEKMFFEKMKTIDVTKGLWLLHKREEDNAELFPIYAEQFEYYAGKVSNLDKKKNSHGNEKKLKEVWQRILLYLHIVDQNNLNDAVYKLIDGSYMYENVDRGEMYARNLIEAYKSLCENEFWFEKRYSDIMLAIMESNSRMVAKKEKITFQLMLEESSGFYKKMEKDLKNYTFSSWARKWESSDKQYLFELIQHGEAYAKLNPLKDNPYYYAASCFFERIVGDKYNNKDIDEEVNERLLKTAYPRCVDAVRRCLYGRTLTVESCESIQNKIVGLQGFEQNAKWDYLLHWYKVNVKLLQLRNFINQEQVTEEDFLAFCEQIAEKISLIHCESTMEWYYTDAIDNFMEIVRKICDEGWNLDVFLKKVDYLNFCKQDYHTFMVNYEFRVRNMNLDYEKIQNYLARYSSAQQIELYFNSPLRFGIKLEDFLRRLIEAGKDEKNINAELSKYRISGLFMRDKKSGRVSLKPASIASTYLYPEQEWLDRLGGWLNKKGDYTFAIGLKENQMIACNIEPYDLSDVIAKDKIKFENELRSLFVRAQRHKKVFAFPSDKVCFDISKGFFLPKERKQIAIRIYCTIHQMIKESVEQGDEVDKTNEICKTYMNGFLNGEPHKYCNEYRVDREGKKIFRFKWFDNEIQKAREVATILKEDYLDKESKLLLYFGTYLKGILFLEEAMEMIDMKEQDYTSVELSSLFRENMIRIAKREGSNFYTVSYDSALKTKYKIHLNEEVEDVECCRIVKVDRNRRIIEVAPVCLEDLEAEERIIEWFSCMTTTETCEKLEDLQPAKRWSIEGIREISVKQLKLAKVWSGSLLKFFRDIRTINPFYYESTVVLPDTYNEALKEKIIQELCGVIEQKLKGKPRCIENAAQLYVFSCIGVFMSISEYIDKINQYLELSDEDQITLTELIERNRGKKR